MKMNPQSETLTAHETKHSETKHTAEKVDGWRKADLTFDLPKGFQLERLVADPDIEIVSIRVTVENASDEVRELAVKVVGKVPGPPMDVERK